MKTAFVHDWLVSLGGAERCLEAMYELYPSPIYTLVADQQRFGDIFPSAEITTSFLQKIPFAKKLYRNFLPLFPRAVESFDLSPYDVVISSSHAVAKGAMTHAEQLHICYCYSPMRYAWDLYFQYLQPLKGIKRIAAINALSKLRAWDQYSSVRVDQYVAISHFIARRIKKIYGRESKVIYPPVDTRRFFHSDRKDNYFIALSRFVPYKRMDLIAEAFSHLPDQKLIMIGEGPERKRIQAKASKNVEFLGELSDSEVAELLSKARAFIFAAEEDFGIAPVEAQAAGIPVIAYGKGAVLETVRDGETGLFFREQNSHSLTQAILRFQKMEDQFDPREIQNHAARFSRERFLDEMKQVVDYTWRDFNEERTFGRRKRDETLASFS